MTLTILLLIMRPKILRFEDRWYLLTILDKVVYRVESLACFWEGTVMNIHLHFSLNADRFYLQRDYRLTRRPTKYLAFSYGCLTHLEL